MRSMNNKAKIRKPLSRSANERISDDHVLRLAYGDANFPRVVCHPVKNTRELPQLYLSRGYRHTARKRGFDEYGGGLANALSFL